MSDEAAIIFDHVSKMYHKRAGMGTLLSMIPGLRRRQPDEFWALKDVSFEVKRGECLGIIGPNGAGKSTILKILSRITSPTSGSFRVNGRLSSLIEVGAGFHPELTGRENIYLNAAILGMSKKETDAKFKDIVDFAEMWDFIDVPVKRYSSGMYVRLGFSVAIHTEPDVLLVDEALAVGDISFQYKCINRIGNLLGSDTTVLLVSHSMNQVSCLCSAAVLLEEGQIRLLDKADTVVHEYLRRQSVARSRRELSDAGCRIIDVAVLDETGQPAGTVVATRPFEIRIRYDVDRELMDVVFGIQIIDSTGRQAHTASTYGIRERGRNVQSGGEVRCLIQHCSLCDGMYDVTVGIASDSGDIRRDLVWQEHAAEFRVVSLDGQGGYVRMHHRWEFGEEGTA